MAEGDLIETETAQGQNKMIDDDTRARAMAAIAAGGQKDEEMMVAKPKKKKAKSKASSNAAVESHSRMNAAGDTYRKGGTASSRADGIASKGKTKGKIC